MSKEYLENIQYVDQGIKRMYELFEEYFNHDNSTAYIMTSDHGMTNWGSHGAGHAHETLTPLVAWGAGLNKPDMTELNGYNDELSEQWGLHGVKRCDVSQADIAPLMSSLIGKYGRITSRNHARCLSN
jgi:phosphatidylinositol glycan class N